MTRTLYLNLPVADVAASTAFYEAIGMVRDPRFSNEVAAGMVWSDAIIFMLLAREFYATFTTKAIADTHATSAALSCLSQEDRAAVDRLVDAAIAAGGRETRAAQDHGFMYGRAFEDLDGHGFEVMHMDPGGASEE